MLTIIRRERPSWARKRLDEGEPPFPLRTRREHAVWRAARGARGGSTAAAYYCSNLSFATGTAVHTALYVLSPAGHGLTLVEAAISFDGVTASAVPVLVELCTTTNAGAGTPAASPPTPVQVRGAVTGGSAPTVTHNFTVEPTVLVQVRQWLVSPNGGLFVYPLPLGREIEALASAGAIKGLALRVTSAATVNARCYMEVEALG